MRRVPIRKVAVVAVPGVHPFELGIAFEGFGIDRTEEGIPSYDCSLVSETGQVLTSAGWTISDALPAGPRGTTPTW